MNYTVEQSFISNCRLCLRDDSVLYGIFEENIAEAIFACVSVEVSKNDTITKYICVVCLQKIKSWCSFKKQCLEAQMVINNSMNNKTTEVENSISLNDNVSFIDQFSNVICVDEKESMVQVENSRSLNDNVSFIDQFSNAICVDEKESMVQENLSDDSTSNSIIDSNDVERSVSALSYTSEDYYAMIKDDDDAASIVSGVSEKSELNCASNKTQPLSQCEYCLRTYKRRGCLLNHLRVCKRQVPVKLKPDYNEKIFEFDHENLLALNETLKSCLTKQEFIFAQKFGTLIDMMMSQTCLACKQNFNSKTSLLRHLKMTHCNTPLWMCTCCFICCQNRSEFTTHVRSKTCLHKRLIMTIKKYECQMCNASLNSINEFKKHICEHEEKVTNSFRCKKCGVLFTTFQEYCFHTLTSDCFMLILCSICEKYFTSGFIFLLHSCIRVPPATYLSQYMVPSIFDNNSKNDQIFAYLNSLKNNSLTSHEYQSSTNHTSLTEIVNKNHFTKKEICNLTSTHMHKNELQKMKVIIYSCSQCPNSYNNSVSLKRHSRTHNNDRGKKKNCLQKKMKNK